MLEGDSFKLAVAAVLPKHLTADRFVRVAIMAMTRTPLLAQCDPATFFQCLMNLSQMGLEPDGRRAHLIPFFNSKRNCYEATLIVDYKGLAELVMRSGTVSNIHADVVCDNDTFDYDRGMLVTHKIDFRKDRGGAYAVYCLVRFKDGSEKAEVMQVEEVNKIRDRSQGYQSAMKKKFNHPWISDWREMAKKTVFRRLSKWLSLSPEFRDALDKDQDTVDDLRLDSAKPAIEVTRSTFELPETIGDKNDAVFDQDNADADSQGPISQPSNVTTLPTEPTPENPEADAATKRGRPVTNFVKAVKGLLTLSGISEVDLIAFLHQTGQLDESVATVQDMAKVAEVTLKTLHDNWAKTEAEIKRTKGATT